MDSLKIYRRILIVLLIFSIGGTLFYAYKLLENQVPNQLTLFVNEEEELNFSLPANGEVEHMSVFKNETNVAEEKIHFDFSKPVSIKANRTGSYKLMVKLFGFIQLKEMEINVVERIKATPIGESIGIYVETDGIMVLGTGSVIGMDGASYEPALSLICSGDYILSANDITVTTIRELSSMIQTLQGKEVILKVRRKEEVLKIKVTPVKAADGTYKLGIWTREDTQGIGTLTYIDEKNGFGALGHGITDADTGILMEVKTGSIYEAQILDIVKGEAGKPGEVVGMIQLGNDKKLGEIFINTEQGIYGNISNGKNIKSYRKNINNDGDWDSTQNVSSDGNKNISSNENMSNNKDINDNKSSNSQYFSKPMEIALKQEIKLGKAQIFCDLGEGVAIYEIEIEKLQMNSNNINKSMVIRITDEKLLKKTNGIVQGMSGSPIIQNGKLIGAVTHVFVQNPEKGYGIFIENMLNVDG